MAIFAIICNVINLIILKPIQILKIAAPLFGQQSKEQLCQTSRLNTFWFSQEFTFYTKKNMAIFKFQFTCNHSVNLNISIRNITGMLGRIYMRFFATCLSFGAHSDYIKTKYSKFTPPPLLSKNKSCLYTNDEAQPHQLLVTF